MFIRRAWSFAVLVCLCIALGRIAYTRAIGLRFLAQPAALADGFTTEEAWVVDEIVRDITEMATLATGPASDVRIGAVEGRAHVFRVEAGGSRATIDLDAALWSPRAFSDLAAALLPSGAAAVPAAGGPDVRVPLLRLSPDALVQAGTVVSQALQRNMGNAAAHDAAALTLAAFALRESAGRMGDTRWALNRMTAHLAIADALSGHDDRAIDHRLASAVLRVLTGDQAGALGLLDELEGLPSTPGTAEWTRALKLRIDDDWRVLVNPSRASRLEQREYLRARRATVTGITGVSALAALKLEPDADLIRVIASSSTGVSDGHLSAEAFDYERDESERVYRALHGGRGAPDARALNARAGRAVSGGQVQILPWGAWAEFFARHLAAAVAKQDAFVRLSLGAHERADRQKAELHDRYGSLWSFPLSTLFWTRGRTGSEGDSTYLPDAIEVLLSSPHRVTTAVWAQVEMGTKYEPVHRGVSRPVSWFLASEPRSAYQAAARLVNSGHPRPIRVLDQLVAQAPYDWPLASTYARERYGKKATLAELERLAGRRLQYDLGPIEAAMHLVHNREKVIELERRACGLTASWCTTLGEDVASLGRDEEAAQAYEMAFSDPELDGVTKSNRAGWLIRYYATHRRVEAAVALAKEGARTASFQGLANAGRLYEHLGRLDDAEATFTEGATHYDNWAELTAFYYRRTQVHKDATYLEDWRTSVARLFPDGLSDEPPPAARPVRGVLVEQGSASASYYNLRVGDVIVAVDGWRVANVPQYRAIRAFPVEGRILLTVWRGSQHLDVTIPNRDFVPYFTVADYPPKGWIE